MQSSGNVMGLDKTGLALVLISSILLGIWATMNTIALRNVLLWVGTVIALMYWWNWFRTNKANHTLPSLSGLYWLSITLIGLMFIWVVMHYFFFAQNPQQQFSELKSTWLRSLLAFIIGSATGLALNRSPRFMPWLWLGLLLSFVVLVYQYIPKAIAKQSLFAVDWFGDYIYWAKFNGVLAGTILIAGLLGLLIDSIWRSKTKDKTIELGMTADQKIASHPNGAAVKVSLINRMTIPTYAFVGIFIAVYAFFFIFDAKAGVGMAFILIMFWLGIVLLFILRNAASEHDIRRKKEFIMKFFISFLLVAGCLLWFNAKHIKNNLVWGYLFEDIAMGVQIQKYQHWKDPSGLGDPLRADGGKAEGSAYVRVAWAVVGLETIREHPLGIGIFRNFHLQIKDRAPKIGNYTVYTHSAWIDMGLAFGIPGLLFIPIALIALLLCAVKISQIRFRATIITTAIAVLILYLVGEYAFGHSVEILIYIAGLLCGLTLIDCPNYDHAVPN